MYKALLKYIYYETKSENRVLPWGVSFEETKIRGVLTPPLLNRPYVIPQCRAGSLNHFSGEPARSGRLTSIWLTTKWFKDPAQDYFLFVMIALSLPKPYNKIQVTDRNNLKHSNPIVFLYSQSKIIYENTYRDN